MRPVVDGVRQVRSSQLILRAGDRPDLLGNGLDEVAQRSGLGLRSLGADADRVEQLREALLDLTEGGGDLARSFADRLFDVLVGHAATVPDEARDWIATRS